MTPEKNFSQEQEKRAINGPRPTHLRIQKDSHDIQKPSFSHSNKTWNSDHHPVIIYANSPKIIHAKARDFRALVQNLTGLSRPKEVIENEKIAAEFEESNGSSSSHQYLADMPHFTPNSTNLFFPPLPMHSYSDAASFSPIHMGSSISPTLFAVKREFPKI